MSKKLAITLAATAALSAFIFTLSSGFVRAEEQKKPLSPAAQAIKDWAKCAESGKLCPAEAAKAEAEVAKIRRPRR